MAVTFHIPGPLQSFADGKRLVHLDVAPRSLAEALDALFMVYPGIRDRLVNEQIVIVPAVSGGLAKTD
jgi:hypothetical protein